MSHPAAPSHRRESRATYRRRRLGVGAALLAVLGVGVYAPLTLFAPLEPVEAVIATPAPVAVDAPEFDWPGYGAAAVGAVEVPGSLARAGSERALPMASITKVVTALVVLERHPLVDDDEGPTITIGARDVGHYSAQLAQNGSVTPVSSGQRYTQRELLEISLVKSSNNLTITLAEWAFGSESAFVDAAGEWIAAHGFESMRVVESTGIDPDNVATAAELVELARLALAEPLVAAIVAEDSLAVPHLGRIENTNALLGDDGVNGIKTGTLLDFGANLLFSASMPLGEGEATIVGVILGAPDHKVLDRDVLRLLETAADNLAEVPIVAAGAELGSYTTAWGTVARVVAADELVALTWGDTELVPVLELRAAQLVEVGDELGELRVDGANGTLRVAIVAADRIEDPGPWWRLAHPGLIVGAP